MEIKEECYYCGGPLIYWDFKRRKDIDGFHRLHRECAVKWDNEGRRL